MGENDRRRLLSRRKSILIVIGGAVFGWAVAVAAIYVLVRSAGG